jgi:hypothetical protein
MNIRILLLASLVLAASDPVSAVMLSPDKQGQVLIFPYFGTLGGNSTAVTISSQSTGPKALKVHFRDRQGEAALSFNLYLESRGSWAAALSQVEGETFLTLPDASCTVPTLDDGSGSVNVPMTSGYLEVIEMGVVTDETITTQIEEFDCAALNVLWQENGQWRNDPSYGLEPPSGNLRGTAMLINVGRGTMYSFVASALTEFSDIQQHTAPGEPLPNLTSAHDAGTDQGATTSIVCANEDCINDTWESPLYAVAAVLSARELFGDFSIEANIGAAAEVVMTWPLAEYYQPQASYQLPPVATYLFATRDGMQTGCEEPCSEEFNRPLQLPGVTILSLNYSEDQPHTITPILGEENSQIFPDEDYSQLPESGTILMRLEVPPYTGPVVTPAPSPIWNRPSLSGRVYAGVPVIGFVLQQFTNGQLKDNNGDPVRANYGNVFVLSRTMEIAE